MGGRIDEGETDAEGNADAYGGEALWAVGEVLVLEIR